jgi:deoxyhypusine synthase
LLLPGNLTFDFVSSTSQLKLKEAKCCMGRLTDIKGMNGEAVYAAPAKTGMILLGGGLPKHHICNANLMRNGADFAVFINTAQEYDGSDSGARPDEAVSWGKIRSSANSVKVS